MTVSYAKTGKESRTSAGVSPEDARAAAAELNGAAKDARQAARELTEAGRLAADGIDKAIEAIVNGKIKEAGDGMQAAFERSIDKLYKDVQGIDQAIRDHLGKLLGKEDQGELLAYFAAELAGELKIEISEAIGKEMARQLPELVVEAVSQLLSGANHNAPMDMTMEDGSVGRFIPTGPPIITAEGKTAVPVFGMTAKRTRRVELEVPSENVPAVLAELAKGAGNTPAAFGAVGRRHGGRVVRGGAEGS